MSTERASQLSHKGVTLTTFFGGSDRGQCLQITRPANENRRKHEFEYIQISRAEALELAKDLIDFAQDNLEAIG